MLNINLKINFKEVKKLLNDLDKELTKYEGVKVGYYTDKKEKNSDMLLSEIAIANEFGYTTNNGAQIPSRPFIRNTLKKQNKWNKAIITFMREDNFTMKEILVNVKEIIKTDLKESFTNETYIENAPSTVARKKSSTPLIDTGTLRSAVQGKLILKGEK